MDSESPIPTAVTPTAPSGTVTCLFSDIEGSTRLELEFGTSVYRDIREQHRALLRQAWSDHAGTERGTEGDSFFVIFGGAADAVAAAVDGQQALAAATWPDDVAVRVRMGLHTGDVEWVGDDVIGLAINRAARIAAAAHGGQVIVSATTRAVVEDRLPDGVTLRDLGEHRLKDLGAAERLAQLVIDGLPADFPPPRTLDAHPNNLPTQLTTFIGRDREVAEVADLLRTTRLVTLTGPGGTGKTRLSLQAAAAAATDFPDGVWFVALEPVRDPALVAPTILRTLGVVDASDQDPVDVLAATIGERRILLVLDNVEQVIAAGPILADVLRRCPHVTCLVTSRISLRVSGEHELPVDGLPAPPDVGRLTGVERLQRPDVADRPSLESLTGYESVRLFVARAAAVRGTFELTDANAVDVAGIVTRLHGMPLAIELAAARTKLLTPDRILARLDQHLDLLSAGATDLPERQRTLRGAIAWSYDLLDPGAQRLLDRLSVFNGGFELEMAEAVCGPADEVGGDVVDRLGELLDQSLIRRDDMLDPPRFGMLDTIRAYAAERLVERGEADALAMRHAEAVLAFVEDAATHFAGADQRRWLDALEREHDNLRAALDWAERRPEPDLAVDLAHAAWRFWQQRGYLTEARTRLESMAAAGWTLPPERAMRFAETIGGIAYWQSDEPATRRWYDEQLRWARQLGDPAQIANALFNRSYAEVVVLMRGRPVDDRLLEGQAMLEEALALYQGIGDRHGEANILWGLGSFHYFTADAATAESWYRRSIELQREVGDRTMEAWGLHMLALSLAGRRHWEEARDTARHALQHFQAAGDVAGITLVLDDLAIVAVADGDPIRAGRLWGGARRLQATTGTALADYVKQTQELFGVATPSDALSPDVLATEAARGAAMGLDDLVAYALGLAAGSEPGDHEESHR